MRALTLTWTPITLFLVILVTSSIHTQAQSRGRTITKAQIDQIVKNFKSRQGGGGETPEQKSNRLFDCTQNEQKCRGTKRSLVTKELLLRLQIRERGEECTSSDGNYSTALYGSPYSDRDIGNYDAYEIWQDEILDTGLIFCNPFEHMSCSSISKKCECRPGTVWRSYQFDATFGGNCAVIVGGYCWIPGLNQPDGDTVAFYDPISTDFKFGLTSIDVFTCKEKFDGDFICTPDLKLFHNNICANKEIRDLDEKLENQFKDLPRLNNFGDSCNLEHQTQLFTTTDAEVNDYKIRVKNLEAILAAKTPFCDLRKLLMCGSGGKCECIKPSTYNPTTKLCVFKNPHDTCQGQTTFEKMTDKFPGRVGKEVMEGFQTVRERDCPFYCSLAKIPDSAREIFQPNVSFCHTCSQDFLIGKKCDKDLTLLLVGNPPFSLPIDIPEYDKQLELFLQFNEKAKEFEKLFRLAKNTKCDYLGELEVYRSIRRIKNVEFPDKIFTEQNYRDLMSSMDKHIGQFGGKGLCRQYLRGQGSDSYPFNRPILFCGPTSVNSICFETNNTFYFNDLIQRLSGPSFQATPTSGNCAPHPKDQVKFAQAKYRDEGISPSDDNPLKLSWDTFEYMFNTLENYWIDNSKVCNRTGGFNCTKSVYDKTNATGKCVFSQELKKEVEVEAEREAERLAKLGLNSKSSHHSVQHFLQTILLFILHIILLN